MALVPLFSLPMCQDCIQPSLHCGKGTVIEHLFPSQRIFGCFSSSCSFNYRKRCLVPLNHTELFSNARVNNADDDYTVNNRRSIPFCNVTEVHSWNKCGVGNHLKSSSYGVSTIDRHFLVPHSSATESNERQLKSLDSYFSKLHDMNEECISHIPTTDSKHICNNGDPTSRLEQKVRSIDKDELLKAKAGLFSLENYFDKLSGGMKTRETTSPPSTEDDSESSLTRSNIVSKEYFEKAASTMPMGGNRMSLENTDDDTVPVIFGKKNSQDSQPCQEASDFYLINLLASVDIAVFLFEIASPIRSSDVEQLSLPLIYGAKINKLILDGEWWRLLTPMFLHSGFLHVALGCWVLLTFGPEVCRGYGPFTFFLIYVLGGICANVTSFIHTPDVTVCGTGPVFAVIGAWLIYQVQNKEAIGKDISENLFWKAVFATALSFMISNFEQADEWSHVGAVFSGLVYGFLTCPATNLDKLPPENGRKEGIALIKKRADPCKSAVIFTLSIFILCSLVFMFEPGLDILELDDLA